MLKAERLVVLNSLKGLVAAAIRLLEHTGFRLFRSSSGLI